MDHGPALSPGCCMCDLPQSAFTDARCAPSVLAKAVRAIWLRLRPLPLASSLGAILVAFGQFRRRA
eukprot:9496098-Pyramimonas_sp.AAC.1